MRSAVGILLAVGFTISMCLIVIAGYGSSEAKLQPVPQKVMSGNGPISLATR